MSIIRWLPRWLSGKESACQCRRPGFHPWVGKIPWRCFLASPAEILGLLNAVTPGAFSWSAALFCLLHAKRWRRAASALVLMAALFVFWCFRAAFLPAEILIVSGGGTELEPAVVVTDPALGRADVVNVPDYRTGIALADYLRERGINIVDLSSCIANGEYTMIWQIALPPGLEIRKLTRSLELSMKPLGMRIGLRHLALFKATNEI